MEWQCIGDSNWVFGEKVRGIVRKSVAEVYYEEKSANCQGAWLWFLVEIDANGSSATLREAIVAAEKACGRDVPK